MKKTILILFTILIYSCKDSEIKQYEITYTNASKDTMQLYTFYKFNDGCIYENSNNATVCNVRSLRPLFNN